jgi:hypothetical protein
VLGGMILSTFLNLVLVPVIYVLVVNLREGGKKRRKGPAGGPPAARLPAVAEASPARV